MGSRSIVVLLKRAHWRVFITRQPQHSGGGHGRALLCHVLRERQWPSNLSSSGSDPDDIQWLARTMHRCAYGHEQSEVYIAVLPGPWRLGGLTMD